MKTISRNGCPAEETRLQKQEGHRAAMRRALRGRLVTTSAERRVLLLISSGWRPSTAADAVGLDTSVVQALVARSSITRRRKAAKKFACVFAYKASLL